jgi:hypothetical protein
VDNLRGHARVETLINKMERLRQNQSFEDTAKVSMMAWIEAIRTVQRRRRQEIVNAANAGVKIHMIGGQQQALKMPDEKEVLGLTEAIRELGVAERKARTSLWAALQITIDDAAATAPTPLTSGQNQLISGSGNDFNKKATEQPANQI